MRILTAIVLAACATTAGAVCQSLYVPRELQCSGQPFIQTRCYPPALQNYGELLDAYNKQGEHVKLTCGAYVNSYTHTSCANLDEAAHTIYVRCCGTTTPQITANCPNVTAFITYP